MTWEQMNYVRGLVGADLKPAGEALKLRCYLVVSVLESERDLAMATRIAAKADHQ